MKSSASKQIGLDWKLILRLGQELVHLTTVSEQKRQLEETASQITSARVQVWLNPNSFRLPTGFFDYHQSDDPGPLVRQVCEEKRTLQVETPTPTLGLPMISQDVFLAVVTIEKETGQGFTVEEVEFLESLAGNAAAAFQNSRQAAIRSWRYEQLNLVRTVSAQIANLVDLDELSVRITRLICDTFHYYYVGLYTLHPGNDHLSFRASASASPLEEDQSFSQIELGQGIVGTVAQTGVEILANDVGTEPRFRYIDTLPDAEAEFAIPLKIENRVLGVLDVQSNQKDAYHEIDVLVLHALADNIALAVEGTRLYNDLHQRAEQVAIVGEVSRAITSILDLDALLEEVVRLIHRRFGFPFVHLFTVHEGRRKVIYRAGSGAKSSIMREKDMTFDLDDAFGMIPWVARNGKTLVANDVTTEAIYRPSDLPPQNTQAELAIPIKFGGDTLGVLDVQSDQRNAFSNDDRFLLETLSDSISIAIRNAMAYQTEHWRRQVAESLRNVAGMLSSEVDLTQILNAILRELVRNLPCEIGAFWLVEGDYSPGGQFFPTGLRLAAVHGKDIEIQARLRELSVRSSDFLDQALSIEVPYIRKPEDPVGPVGKGLGFPEDYSAITSPLRVGSQTFGVLVIAHSTSGRYGNEAISMVTAFSSYASIAIQNTRLYASIQAQAWISTVMLQVSEATQSIRSIDELLSAMVRLTPMLVGVKSTAVLLWNESGSSFSFSAHYELSPPLLEWLESHRPEIHAHPKFIQIRSQTGALACSWPDFGITPIAGETATQIHLLPMSARGVFLGAYLVEEQIPAEANSGNQINQVTVLQGIVQQTAIAIENISLLESKQEEAYVTAVLLQVAQAVVSRNNLDDILDSIVHIMPILVGIDTCIVYLWDEAHKLFRPSHLVSGSPRIENALLTQLFSPGEYPLLDRVFQTDSMLVLPLNQEIVSPMEWPVLKLSEDQDNLPATLDDSSSLLIGVPLTVKGEVYGVLLAQESGSASGFRGRRLEIISGIAQQAALAIQNANLTREMVGRERLEREIQLAREIQRTFLPSQLPSPDGWQVNYRWRTARQVGGDFYDCFELSENRLGIVIADVSDKGMPAAMVMTVSRTLIRATALEDDSPASVLERVNGLLLMDSQTGMFITVVYAILDLKSSELVYCVAGQNLPLWIHSQDGAIEPFIKDGVALGVWPDIHLHDHLIRLAQGDTLVFYTDGVTDANSPEHEFFGEERLLLALNESLPTSVEDVLDRIDSAVVTFQGDEPSADDMTLLVIYKE